MLESPRVQLAVNYSAPADDLVRTGRIDVDLFKCPDWPEVIRQAGTLRPTYVHFPIQAGQGEGMAVDLDHVADVLAASGTPHVNTHLDPRIDPQDGLFAGQYAAIRRTFRDVEMLVAHFGEDRVVAENVPYWRERPLHEQLAAEPSFIRQIVEETGCGLLLDLAHARLAARGLGMDERVYLSLLPVEHLRELHVTGLGSPDGWLRDHMPMTRADWEILCWALEQIAAGVWAMPRIVACEYGGVGETFAWRSDPAVLAEQMPILRTMVHALAGQSARPEAA